MILSRFSALRFVMFAAVAVSVSGCMMSVPPSRGETGAQSLMSQDGASFQVRQLNVIVPRDLVVSEDNSYKPRADIVWHGDAQGNRYEQVQRIVRAAMQTGTAAQRAGMPVIVDVQVSRFHALTPKTRASIGGRHELEYMLTLRDAATGGVLRVVPRVVASVRGAGGATAAAEEAAGRTQEVVIREALAASIQKELSRAAPSTASVARAATAALTSTLR